MALFTSIQSGNWHDSTTWDVGGGGVPDLSIDDVVIDTGHEVIAQTAQNMSLGSGRMLVVAQGATLGTQFGMYIYGGQVIVEGVFNADGYFLMLGSSGEITIQSTGTLNISTSLSLESNAIMRVEGEVIIASDGCIDVYYFGELILETSGSLQNFNRCYIQHFSNAVIHGDFEVEVGGYFNINHESTLEIAIDGALFVLGELFTWWDSRIEVFGYLGVSEDGSIDIGSDGLVNVYSDIHISGRMTGGGQIAMLRREGCITDYAGNSLFILDCAYGYGQTRIA